MKRIITGILIGIIIFSSTALAAPVKEEVEISEEVLFWSEIYGEQYGICPEIIQAMCWTESRCNPTAQSPDKACKGLMQIKPSCHQERMERLGVRNIFGCWENIKTGTDYLAELAAGEPDIAVALARYNGQSDEKIEKARRGEYSGYVKQILELAGKLEEEHGK